MSSLKAFFPPQIFKIKYITCSYQVFPEDLLNFEVEREPFHIIVLLPLYPINSCHYVTPTSIQSVECLWLVFQTSMELSLVGLV